MGAAETILVTRLVRSLHKTINNKIAKASTGTTDIQAGTVTQVTPLMVRMAGTTNPAPAFALSSYSPRTVGDKVLVHMNRKELYVAGTLS